MRNNNKEVKNAVRSYIIECITIEEEDTDFQKNKINFIEDYKNQVLVNKVQKMTIKDAIIYTVQGLYKGFDYTNFNIINLIDSWIPENNYTDDKKIKMFYYLIARESMYIFDNYKLDNFIDEIKESKEV